MALLHQVDVDSSVLDDAATLALGTVLRTLDSIHLASARLVGADLRALDSYDQRMAAAAAGIGLPVETPVSHPGRSGARR